MTATVEEVLAEMAVREAEALLLVARDTVPVFLAVLRCRTCGADEATLRRCPGALPFAEASFLAAGAEPPTGSAVVTQLGCEVLPARALLAAVTAVENTGRTVRFRTRAATVSCSPLGMSTDPFEQLLHLAEAERSAECFWKFPEPVSATPFGARALPLMTLPVSTRMNPAAVVHQGLPTVTSTFVAPHALAGSATYLDRIYRPHLRTAVRAGL